MQQYDSMYDDTGNVMQDRICVFIYTDTISDDGTFSNYQFSQIITSEKSGIMFIIDESEVDNLHHYKISFDEGTPKLIRKEESEAE